MRILVVASEFHRRGGFPRLATQTAGGLAARGHAVTVLTRSAETATADAALSFLCYRAPRRSALLTMALEPVLVGRAVRRVEDEFDAVVVIGMPILAAAVLEGTGTHRGYVNATLETLPRWSLRRWFERLRPFHRIVNAWEHVMLRRPHPRLIVTAAPAFRQEYIDIYGIEPGRVVALPLAVEHDEFRFDPSRRARVRSELGITDDTFVMLNVSGRGRQKGLDVLVAALARLPRDRVWTALLAGGGSEARAVAAQSAEMRADGRVRLLGRVADTADLFCAADLLVFPSRYDPWGLVVTEALSSGLPVVVSSKAGASMAVTPEAGLVVDDPTSVDEVAAAIVQAWTRAYDRAVVASAVESFTIDARARELEALITSLPARGDEPDR